MADTDDPASRKPGVVTYWINFKTRRQWMTYDPDAVQQWRAIPPSPHAKSARRARQIEHDIYLASPEWRIKRKMVLDRCHYVCEGCGTQSACEVHHLTYEHWRAEFLFELLGLCRTCHQRLEGKER